ALDHVDGLGAVRREIEVVRVRNVDRSRRPAGVDVDHGQAARALVLDVQLAQVPRRGDVVGDLPDGELIDHLKGRGADHFDVAVYRVGHVDARPHLSQRAWNDT